MHPSRLAALALSVPVLLLASGAACAGGYRHAYPGYHAHGIVLRGPHAGYVAPPSYSVYRGWHAGVHSGWHGAVHGGWHPGVHGGLHSGWHSGYHAAYHAQRRNLAGAFALGVIGGGLAGAAIAHASGPTVIYPPTVVQAPSPVQAPPLVQLPPVVQVAPVVQLPPVLQAPAAVYPPPGASLPPLALVPGTTVISSTIVPAPVDPAYGTVYSSLPPACVFEQVNAQPYYRCGSYWYRAQFGAQGPQYVFVAPPRGS